jgi:hypothetical protein
MARLTASPLAQAELPDERKEGFAFENLPDGLVEVPDLTPGVVTAIPRSNRPPGSSLSIVNGRVRDNWVGRRGGYPDYIVEPDSNLVLKLISFHGEQNQNWLVRVANGSTHATRTTAGWTALTGTDYSSFLRLSHAQMLGSLYTAMEDKKIVKFDLDDLSFAEVDEAPTCRYITPFADRLIAAYIRDPAAGVLPWTVKWSVNADPLDWDGSGSGEENLIQHPSDTGDEITAIMGLGNVMVILRERSIWHATRQPYQSAPMRFTPIITNQGCDMPYTAVRTMDEQGRLTGIIFADSNTNGVFSYTPGSRPQRLSKAIEDKIFENLVDPETAEAAFDPLYQEYHLGISTDLSNYGRMEEYWVLSANHLPGALPWTYDDSPTSTTVGVVSDVGAPTLIDDAVGTIDAQVGVIDSFEIKLQNPIVLKGGTAGEVLKEDLGTAGTHTYTWTTQDLGALSNRRLLKILQIAISATASGSTVLEYSKNTDAEILAGTATWTNIKTVADPSSLEKIGFKRGLSGDRIHWRIQSDAKEFRMFEWWAKMLEKGIKHLV